MPPRSLSHLLGKKSPADCAAGRKCAGSTYQSSQCIIILKTLTTAKTFFNLILYHHTLLFFIYLPTYHLNRPARSSRHWSTSSWKHRRRRANLLALCGRHSLPDGVVLAMNSYLLTFSYYRGDTITGGGILFGRCATPAGDRHCTTAIRALAMGSTVSRAWATRNLVESTIDSRRARRFCNRRVESTIDSRRARRFCNRRAHLGTLSVSVLSQSRLSSVCTFGGATRRPLARFGWGRGRARHVLPID